MVQRKQGIFTVCGCNIDYQATIALPMMKTVVATCKPTSKSRTVDMNCTVDMNFTVSGLSFASAEGKYRLVSSSTAKDLSLKLERLRSPNQWQTSVSDIAAHGPAGIPQEVVFSTFKTVLESMVSTKEDACDDNAKKVSDAATLDLEIGDKGVITMYLDIPVAGFSLTYVFEFLPLAREPMDELSSSLRDAHDDINMLQRAIKPHQVIALRSSIECQNNQAIQWNVLVHNSDTSLFQVSHDHCTISVKEAGVYMVNVRVTSGDSSGSRREALEVNGTAVADTYMGDNTGYVKTITTNEVLVLQANDKLTYRRIQSNYNTTGGATANAMFIMRL